MDTNLPALFAGVAVSAGICAHGVVGHRWLATQLASAEMQPTPLSARLFGARDVSREVFGVTWHSVTAVFLASATALYLTAFGALESRDLLRFIAVLHASFLGVGALYVGIGRDAFRGLIPPLFVVGMTAAAVLAWVASNSV
jgi:hypothetical protein